MKRILGFMVITLLLCNCNSGDNKKKTVDKTEKPTATPIANLISAADISATVVLLTKKHEATEKERIEKGVARVAALWQKSDGTVEEFKTFCTEKFIPQGEKLDIAFDKLSANFEIMYGMFNKMQLDLRVPLELDKGEVTDIDMLFGAYNASAHITQDFFANKIAFLVALNFRFFDLEEKMKKGENWSRKEWAFARMGDMFTSRISAEVLQEYSKISTDADAYISEYNIYMGKLLTENGEKLFPEKMKLITHWGLRDEIKSNYAVDNGLVKQEMVYSVMQNIINQSIPESVINSDKLEWNPNSNKVYENGKEIAATPEPNTRYQHMLNVFRAIRKIDAYNPQVPTYLDRKFDEELEIPMEQIEQLFTELVSSPQIRKVGKIISKRLCRKLRPFDIWYDGFKARSSINEDDLNKQTREKYPTAMALENDLANILRKLQFTDEKAEYIASKIRVDASRGAGHAAGASMRGDKARLRTRVGKNGMNYKGYNIAVHEFGHNVEQTISLYDVDYYTMNGVPNTGFTEALAFLFQKRDLELLGMKDETPNKKELKILDQLWAAYEIMGVSLVDMKVWQWMYDNQDATPAQLKGAIDKISKEVWNKYFADVFESKDEPILAIYSHMVIYPLYLPAYPIGQLIEFQIGQYVEGKNFATETERMFKQGRIVPQQWMREAVGNELSIKPMLDAADEAMKQLDE